MNKSDFAKQNHGTTTHVKQKLTHINSDKARVAGRSNLLNQLDPFKRLWGRNDTEAHALRECEFALVTMMDSRRFPCKILEWGNRFAYVELQDTGRRCLISGRAMAEVYPCATIDDLWECDQEEERDHDA